MKELTSVWTGSERTYQEVKRQIEDRFGPEVAANYHPEKNVFSYKGWLQRNHRVKRGETSMRIQSFIEKVDGEGRKIFIPKQVYLFHECQTEQINKA